MSLAQEFRERGFIVLEDLVDHGWVDALRERLAEIAVGERDFPERLIEYEPGIEHRRTLSSLRKINSPAGHDELFLEYASNTAVLDVVAQLIGGDIKLFGDQAFMKPAGGVEKTYHQDSAYFHIDPPDLVTCWLALDDVTIDNGCLWVIPGSHLGGIKDHSQEWEIGDRVDMMIPDEALDRSREVPITMRSGSCSFHHSVLMHRSGPNRTERARRGLATHYMSASLRWVGELDQKPEYPLLRGREHAGAV